MSLADKLADKILGPFGWALLKSLTRIATAIEKGIDSHREICGYQPLFASHTSPATTSEESPEGEGFTPPDREPDFMRQEILTLLAAEQHVMITGDTDLVVLGKSRGWLNEAGEVVMLPQGYGQ